MWSFPGSGITLMSLALAGRFFTTEPQGNPLNFIKKLLLSVHLTVLYSWNPVSLWTCHIGSWACALENGPAFRECHLFFDDRKDVSYWGPPLTLHASWRLVGYGSLLRFWLCGQLYVILPMNWRENCLSAMPITGQGDEHYWIDGRRTSGPSSGTRHGRKRQWLNRTGLEELIGS